MSVNCNQLASPGSAVIEAAIGDEMPSSRYAASMAGGAASTQSQGFSTTSSGLTGPVMRMISA